LVAHSGYLEENVHVNWEPPSEGTYKFKLMDFTRTPMVNGLWRINIQGFYCNLYELVFLSFSLLQIGLLSYIIFTRLTIFFTNFVKKNTYEPFNIEVVGSKRHNKVKKKIK